MNRYLIIVSIVFFNISGNAQSDFNKHIGAHLSSLGMSSMGYPFSTESGLYGHFLPEIIKEDATLNLAVSPNPFTHSFSVSCDDVRIHSIELRNVLGHTVFTSEEKEIYQPNVPSGKYYLIAVTSGGQAIKTIIHIE
jgi:hypothetical protein